MAQGEGEADKEEKERGSGAGHRQPEAGGDINIVDCKIVEIEYQMVENHEEDGHSSQQVHLPETDRRALDQFTIIFHSLVHSSLKAALSFLTSTFRSLYIPLYFDGSQSVFSSQTYCTSISTSTVVDFSCSFKYIQLYSNDLLFPYLAASSTIPISTSVRS